MTWAIIGIFLLGALMIALALRDAWRSNESDGIGDWIILLVLGTLLVAIATVATMIWLVVMLVGG